jgi:hypothetical protein
MDKTQTTIGEQLSAAIRRFFGAEFFIYGRIHVDQHGILAETGNLSPRNHDILAFAEAKRSAIEKHDDGGNASGAYVDDGIADVAEPFAVADIDHFLIA